METLRKFFSSPGFEGFQEKLNGPGYITVGDTELHVPLVDEIVSIGFTNTVIVQWFVMIFLGVLFYNLGKNLKVNPDSKRQMLAETIHGLFTGMVKEAMGDRYKGYVYYIAALFCFSFTSSMSTLLGFRPPTTDLSVLASWALITYALVQINRFKTGGIKGYTKSFLEPAPPLLPLNILGEITSPLSQAFRHFGNIFAGFIVMTIIYNAAGYFAVFFPAVLSLYFDIFSAVIQAYIFTSLTMCYVVNAERHEKLSPA